MKPATSALVFLCLVSSAQALSFNHVVKKVGVSHLSREEQQTFAMKALNDLQTGRRSVEAAKVMSAVAPAVRGRQLGEDGLTCDNEDEWIEDKLSSLPECKKIHKLIEDGKEDEIMCALKANDNNCGCFEEVMMTTMNLDCDEHDGGSGDSASSSGDDDESMCTDMSNMWVMDCGGELGPMMSLSMCMMSAMMFQMSSTMLLMSDSDCQASAFADDAVCMVPEDVKTGSTECKCLDKLSSDEDMKPMMDLMEKSCGNAMELIEQMGSPEDSSEEECAEDVFDSLEACGVVNFKKSKPYSSPAAPACSVGAAAAAIVALVA